MNNPSMQELRNENARLKKKLIALQDENNFLKGEIRGIGHRKVIAGEEEQQTTTDKIKFELDKRSASWIWYRDKVLAGTLSTLQTFIVLALLYLAFAKDIPK